MSAEFKIPLRCEIRDFAVTRNSRFRRGVGIRDSAEARNSRSRCSTRFDHFAGARNSMPIPAVANGIQDSAEVRNSRFQQWREVRDVHCGAEFEIPL